MGWQETISYGLSDQQLEEIIQFIAAYPQVEEAILFGSRAIGTHKPASDVDIVIKGDGVNSALAPRLKFDIEEDTYLPYFFDFVAYGTITREALKQHIDEKGISIYRKAQDIVRAKQYWIDFQERYNANP